MSSALTCNCLSKVSLCSQKKKNKKQNQNQKEEKLSDISEGSIYSYVQTRKIVITGNLLLTCSNRKGRLRNV